MSAVEALILRFGDILRDVIRDVIRDVLRHGDDQNRGYLYASFKKDNAGFALEHRAIFAGICGFQTAAFAVNYTGLIKQHWLVLEDCNRCDDNSNEEDGCVPLDKLQARSYNEGIFA